MAPASMHSAALCVGLLAASTSAKSLSVGATTSAAGTLMMKPYANNVPINMSWSTGNSGTASVFWTYDVDGGGAHCVPDQETGLTFTMAADGTVSFIGTGKDPAYYSFFGTLKSDGTMVGTMNNPSSVNMVRSGKPGGQVGTFSVKVGAPLAPYHCVTPPPSPPPPAPHATTHAFIWPLPSSYTNGTGTVSVTPSSSFFSSTTNIPFISQAFARYMDITFPHAVSTSAEATDGVASLTVAVDSPDDSHPQVETNETYTLEVSATGQASLHAATVYGMLRGLETFSQLVVFNFTTQSYQINGAPWMITDTPRFPHRGLMIDTARHFQTLASIRMMIDSMTYAKLNVLHWHMSDTQSFPFQSKTYPKLWDAAWSSQEKFIQADIADVVEYARLRGVRVLVEFDMPGHAGSWCTGYPEICPSATCNQPLNVANNQTFTVIESLLNECTGGVSNKPGDPSPGLFKSNMIHLGGDEVNTACWTSTPSVNNWLTKQGMTADQGYAYFVKRVADIAIAQGHRPIQWSEVFDHFKYNLTKETIVHIWKDVTNVTEVVAGGYNALVNVGYDKLSWYLDNLKVMWDAVYMNDPCAGVPDNLCPLILGGHGEMWGETVDPSDIQSTVWPRLAAIAERLWSPRDLNSTTDAHDRIQSFRCLLNRRGIGAAPVNNAEARESPPGAGSCLKQ